MITSKKQEKGHEHIEDKKETIDPQLENDAQNNSSENVEDLQVSSQGKDSQMEGSQGSEPSCADVDVDTDVNRGTVNQEESVTPDKGKGNKKSKQGLGKTLAKGGLVGGVSAAASTASVMGAQVGLSIAGFTQSGVAAGSMAAAWQASIGNVVAGSMFAGLQSAGAVGLGSFFLPAAVIGGGIGATCYFGQKGIRTFFAKKRQEQKKEKQQDTEILDMEKEDSNQTKENRETQKHEKTNDTSREGREREASLDKDNDFQQMETKQKDDTSSQEEDEIVLAEEEEEVKEEEASDVKVDESDKSEVE